ncbi:hypothetical protein [Saccharopolyspora rhizosphaerae]|nr:hypothetical protein [Saccharopolyspora rhizosphaerae]
MLGEPRPEIAQQQSGTIAEQGLALAADPVAHPGFTELPIRSWA